MIDVHVDPVSRDEPEEEIPELPMPCPCGNNDVRLRLDDMGLLGCYCRQCRRETDTYYQRADAIHAWNTRQYLRDAGR